MTKSGACTAPMEIKIAIPTQNDMKTDLKYFMEYNLMNVL